MLPSSEMNKMSVRLRIKTNFAETSLQAGLVGLFLGLCSTKEELLLSHFLFFFVLLFHLISHSPCLMFLSSVYGGVMN